MMNTQLLKRFLMLGLLSSLALPVWALTKIAADDANLQYSGRIDLTKPNEPQISWPGTSITGNFTGQYLAVTLDDQLGKNYFNVFIDNDFKRPIIIKAE